MRKTITLLFTLLIAFSTIAQVQVLDPNAKKEDEKKKKDSIINAAQWASKVIKYSSQFSKTEKSANMVLGKPNVLPRGGDAPTAWMVKAKHGEEINKPAYIKVGYDSAIYVKQVAVAESFNPGAITEITLYGVNKEKQTVYTNTNIHSLPMKSRMFNVWLKEPTKFKVNVVEVKLLPGEVSGFNEIDAIGISDKDDTIKAYINLIPDLVYPKPPERLNKNVNTEYDDIAPLISPDGKSLYFDRHNYPENAGGINDYDDIWVSDYVDGDWAKAKKIGYPLNNQYNNFVQSITPDNNALLLANVYDEEDSSMREGLSITYRDIEGWSYPKEQVIEDFYNKSPFVNFFLTNDGMTLLMAVKRKDGYNSLDLYVSFLKGENHWSAPKNLGPIINTYADDYSPFLAADGVTLFYSTAGHSGYGGADIFMSKRLDDTWTNWSEPQNLGNVLNSEKNDSKYNIPASGEYAYFSSDHNSIGKNDIFRIKLPEKVKPKPVVLVPGIVVSAKTGEPLDAEIRVEELPSGKQVVVARTDPKTGRFKFIVQPGKKYGFTAHKEGYTDDSKSIDVTQITEYTEWEEVELRLGLIEVGQVIKLNNIFFNTAKATLKPESFPELDRAVKFLNDNPKIKVEIAGHTDSRGSDRANLKLSQNRANSVMIYLIQHGVKKNRMTAKGYGERQPIAFNTTVEGRAANRRVEFRILKVK